MRLRLEEVERSLDELYGQKISIQTENKELSNLRNDIKRLFQLLKNTNEVIFKEREREINLLDKNSWHEK